MYIIKDVLMSLSGKTPSLYRHDLTTLHSNRNHKLSTVLPMNKIPERLVPRSVLTTFTGSNPLIQTMKIDRQREIGADKDRQTREI